ncbi:MAG: hypothetical protein HQ515_10785 [Phycisphaeraceae bacterium]|nr:hypothetical protein [Phycisphaeraceae bacterium]
MLHDPSHYTPMSMVEEISVSRHDRDLLRSLASQKMAIASLPDQQENIRQWTALNDLTPERPMVWINEICWHEMDVSDELTLQCEGAWAREQELVLRRELYQWQHLRGDMVVNPWIECPLAIHSTDFGIIEDTDIATTDEASDVVSRHFNVQISSLDDLEKIRMPEVTHNVQGTAFRAQAFADAFDGILPVKPVGQTHIWFTPWDFLVRWMGVENALIALYDDPDLVHAGVDRLVDAWMKELDQFESQGLLSPDCNNTRVGSGGYGYVSRLAEDVGPQEMALSPRQMWGCSNAQIFSEVSPQMHWEFALEHDIRWLERWGLNYYGCCEPLHQKVDILKRIPRLRKISVSPWCDFGTVLEAFGDSVVYSIKPSPAILAEDTWQPDRARQAIRKILDLAQGRASIEFIMKDISTVRYQPKRLWAWAQIVMEEVKL